VPGEGARREVAPEHLRCGPAVVGRYAPGGARTVFGHALARSRRVAVVGMPAHAEAALDDRTRAGRGKADGTEVVSADVEVGERCRQVEGDLAVEVPLQARDDTDAPPVRGPGRAVAEHEAVGERALVEQVAARVEPRQAAPHLEVGAEASLGA